MFSYLVLWLQKYEIIPNSPNKFLFFAVFYFCSLRYFTFVFCGIKQPSCLQNKAQAPYGACASRFGIWPILFLREVYIVIQLISISCWPVSWFLLYCNIPKLFGNCRFSRKHPRYFHRNRLCQDGLCQELSS